MDFTIQALATLAGLTLITTATMALLKPFIWPGGADAAARDRFGGITTVGVGIAWSIVGIFFLNITGRPEIGQALLNGLFAGLSSIGLYVGGSRLISSEDKLPANRINNAENAALSAGLVADALAEENAMLDTKVEQLVALRAQPSTPPRRPLLPKQSHPRSVR